MLGSLETPVGLPVRIRVQVVTLEWEKAKSAIPQTEDPPLQA
jgi:hypothetical protein